MSLTLYVNYERTNNTPFVALTSNPVNPQAALRYESSTFFRKKRVTPYDIAIYLGDDSESPFPTTGPSYLSAFYVAECRFNRQGNFIPMEGLAAVFTALTAAPSDTKTPTVCSIFVSVSAARQDTILPDSFNFSSDCYKLSSLSSTAFVFEDVATKDVYAFYWPVSGKTSSSVNSLLTSVESLTGRRIVLNELQTKYTNDVYGAVEIAQNAGASFTQTIQTIEYKDYTSTADVIQPIYKILRRVSTFETASGSNYLRVTQTIPDTATFALTSVGGVSITNRIPYLSGDILQYEMSAIFFDEFPTIDFVAFPKNVILQDRLPLSANVADYSNYEQVCGEVGPQFFGEGHAETIYLSANATNASSSASIRWWVGNTEIGPDIKSNLLVNVSGGDGFTASTTIKTVPGQYPTYPIAARILDLENFITEQTPLITYADIDGAGFAGAGKYYPFVYSTMNIGGTENLNNTPLRDNIAVRSYPDPTPLNVINPFSSESLKLPYDNSTQRFVANISKNPALTSILREDVIQTYWSLEAKTVHGDSWSIQANTAPSVENYVFDLSYDEEQNVAFLPLFKTSNYASTTLTLNVSCVKNIKLEVDRIPTDVFVFSYSETELSSSALAFQNVTTKEVSAFYWGANGVDSGVNSLTAALESKYKNVKVVDLGGATTAEAMASAVWQCIPDDPSLTGVWQAATNRLSLTQPTIRSSTNYLVTAIGNQIFHSFETPPSDQTDWQKKPHTQVFTFTTEVLPKPLSIKPFTPSFYNLIYTETPFTVYFEEHEPYKLSAIDLECSLFEAPVRFYPSIKDNSKSKNGLKRTIEQSVIFNKIGLADLKIVAHVIDTKADSVSATFPFVVEFADALEVVDDYDAIDDGYLYSFYSPPQRTYIEAPLLSPNEWLVSENVNDSIKKLYRSFQDLNELTLIYEKKDALHSWLGVSRAPVEPLVKLPPKYIWDDLLCTESKAFEEQTSWFNFECEDPNSEKQTANIKWADHVCYKAPDPNCNGKYCIHWKWKKRKAKNSPTKVTWKSSRRGGMFQKKWQFEKCETDSEEIPCNKLRWNVAAFDKSAFPIPHSTTEALCKFVDSDYIEGENLLVVAHPQVIKLFRDTLEAEHVAQKGTADEMFSFQEIAGISVDSEGKIFVLDKALPKVTILQYSEGDLNIHDSWGNFGFKGNATGFNRPQDIHVDQDNFVWIADTENGCIKKFTANGRPVLTIANDVFNYSPPISLCMDVNYNLHVLVTGKVIVFNKTGNLLFEYALEPEMSDATKINTNYNREMVYVCYNNGVAKYFKTGAISHYLVRNYVCGDGEILQGFHSVVQNESRDTYVIVTNNILKFGDLMKIVELKGHVSESSYWSLEEMLVDREEFVQPWVYLRAFHRLWDNIETVRTALFYEQSGCRSYNEPVHNKTNLVIGQNELVTNTVLNRLIKQLWDNIESLYKYFDPECEKKQK